MAIKQKRYDHHLASIDRHWSNLDSGLQAVLSRVELPTKVESPDAAPEGTEPSLLNQLLKRDVVNQHGSDSEAEEIDSSLEAKCKFTTSILQRVAAGLGSFEQAAVSTDKEQALLHRLDSLQAQYAVLANERAILEARKVRYRQTTEELKNQVDSLEELLEVSCSH